MTRSRKQASLPLYLLNGSPLSTATTYKYLGITINTTLTWNDHVDAAISKANRTLGFIWQMAGGTSTAALASLYKSLVLPVIEYGLPAWTPYTQTAISKIEKIQRRASRICLRQRRGEMDYKDRLRTLGWTSLENRRQKHTITFVIKCLFGLVDCQSVVKITKINARHLDTLIF